MKRGLLLVLFVSLFLIGVVSAACNDGAGNDDNLIMRLYQQNNSHGSLWDGSTLYTTEICYNTIFGGTGSGNHDCKPDNSNAIIWLSDTYNSHASTTNDSTYTLPVCYDGVECTERTVNCEPGEELLISLYDTTNSHITNDSSYGTKICCTGKQITGAQWQKMDETPTAEADLNDLVQLVVPGIGLEDQNITYEIRKSVRFWFDKKIAENSTVGTMTWRAGKKEDTGELSAGNYYFIAELEDGNTINSQDGANPYGTLLVLPNQHNENPVAVITGPNDRHMYFINAVLDFDQASYDVDDEFTYEWQLGDGTNLTGDSVSKNNWNFTHAYTTAGQKDIILTVRDNRGGVGRDQISILILDHPSANNQTLAYINSPQWGESLGRKIDFDASGSYTAKYDGTDVSCLAGDCPITTANCPSGSACVINLTLNPVPPATPNYDSITFNWVFTNGFTGIQASETTPNPTIQRSFDTPSVPSSPHRSKLTVVYTA